MVSEIRQNQNRAGRVHDLYRGRLRASVADLRRISDGYSNLQLVETVIRYMVADTRSWLPGRKVLISPKWVSRIDWPSETGVASTYVAEEWPACTTGPPRRLSLHIHLVAES